MSRHGRNGSEASCALEHPAFRGAAGSAEVEDEARRGRGALQHLGEGVVDRLQVAALVLNLAAPQAVQFEDVNQVLVRPDDRPRIVMPLRTVSKMGLGLQFPFTLVAVLLAAYAVVAYLLLRDAPGRTVAAGGVLRRTWETFRLPVTLQMSFLYAVGFGGFVAFSVYLPTYLRDAFGLSLGDAALRTGGFVVLAVIARPIGGWLSDRSHPVPVLVACFAVVTVFAGVSALEPQLTPVGTIAFLAMAAALGAASGAVFALVALAAPAGKVGAVTGIVGAAGGLGGFAPPLVMGAIYGWIGNYRPGLWLLSATALIAAVCTAWGMRSVGRRPVDA